MECLELGVKILLVVGSISESVQTNAILVVWREVAELHSVPALDDVCDAQRNNLILEGLGADRHRFVINLQIGNGEGLRVNEQISVAGGNALKIEVDHSVAEVVISFLKGKLEVILNFEE